MTRDGVRITLRLHRFELIAFGTALIGLAIAAVIGAAYVSSLKPSPDCALIEPMTFACQRASDGYESAKGVIGSLLLGPLLLVSYAVGLFLGVPIVARELERGTVRLAWSLAPSRWGWYVARVGPILVVLIALTFAAGVATDVWMGASRPDLDLSNAFVGYGARGGLLASRAVFIFAVAVVVGSVIGRALPAVIIGALIAAIGLTGAMYVHQQILKREAVVVSQNQEGVGVRESDLWIDSKFQLPDGTLVDYSYFGDQGPLYDDQGNSLYPQVNLVIPGERYRFVEAREALALAAGSLVALLLAALVVRRRRPG